MFRLRRAYTKGEVDLAQMVLGEEDGDMQPNDENAPPVTLQRDRDRLETFAWWLAEVACTLLMVAIAFGLGAAVVGARWPAMFGGIIGPGDLIIFATVLVASAAVSGITLLERIIRFSQRHVTRERNHAARKVAAKHVVIAMIAFLFVLLFAACYCGVKITVLQLDHELDCNVLQNAMALAGSHESHSVVPSDATTATLVPAPLTSTLNERESKMVKCAFVSLSCCLTAIFVADTIRRKIRGNVHLIERD